MVNISKIDKGTYGITFELGDKRKAGGSVWAKILSGVDKTKVGGYAFEGKFIRSGDIVKEGDIVITVSSVGSWKYPASKIVLYKINRGKVNEHVIGYFNTKAEKLEAVIEIDKLFKKLKPTAMKKIVSTKKEEVPKKKKIRKTREILVTTKEVKERQKKRTSRSQKLDAAKTAKKKYKKNEWYIWIKRPGSGDISGIDTKTKK